MYICKTTLSFRRSKTLIQTVQNPDLWTIYGDFKYAFMDNNWEENINIHPSKMYNTITRIILGNYKIDLRTFPFELRISLNRSIVPSCYASTSPTSLAASSSLMAETTFRPDSSMIWAPSSALVPWSLTMIGTFISPIFL